MALWEKPALRALALLPKKGCLGASKALTLSDLGAVVLARAGGLGTGSVGWSRRRQAGKAEVNHAEDEAFIHWRKMAQTIE